MATETMLTDFTCTSLLVPYLTPIDIARLECVCRELRNTLDSDLVWGRFVPRSTAKVVRLNDEQAPTKKRIFTVLCKPFLLEETLAYWLNPGTGGVCCSLAARGLGIDWGSDRRYWSWGPQNGARWPEVACLEEVWWFHARGNIKCLLPKGAYTLSWRIQYRRKCSGWTTLPVTFRLSMSDGSQATTSHRYLGNRLRNGPDQNSLDDLTPVRQVERWLEFDVGEVVVTDEEKETSLEFSMRETACGTLKSGVVLDGVVLRPTSLTRVTGRYGNSSGRFVVKRR
ncbi:hypothetical protein KC19_11G107200 [Ceratodon purpureus]|uniref:F-box domain-containing protein n=1 Tax=Ceratodon purpureus TaxID=3225 RepID=A0A8T0GG60_CERPU|nr:hypothetical protein KC19_11G107200 [Ceratodon purpureus]